MGGVCARCSEVKKGSVGDTTSPALPPRAVDDDESEASEGSESGHSEVAASSDEEVNQEDYKHGVEEILKSSGKNLKRGKTMAMKEAISTAKKYGLEGAKINVAQQQLDNHIKQQQREECEREVEAFLASPVKDDIPQAEKLAKKAADIEVRPATLKRVRDHLEELLLHRPLEPEEVGYTREALRQSCRELALAATQGGGRPTTLLSLEDGNQEKVLLTLDPPLQRLHFAGGTEGGSGTAIAVGGVPVASLSAARAADEPRVASSEQFKALDDVEQECAVALRYISDSTPGVLCVLEPTQVRRDRLIEGIVVLAVTCR